MCFFFFFIFAVSLSCVGYGTFAGLTGAIKLQLCINISVSALRQGIKTLKAKKGAEEEERNKVQKNETLSGKSKMLF